MAALLHEGLNMDTLHQLAFAATAYAVPAFFAAVGAGMIYGIIGRCALYSGGCNGRRFVVCRFSRPPCRPGGCG